MNIKLKIWLAFTICFFILFTSSVFSYRSTQQLIITGAWVSHTLKVETLVETVISVLKDAETGQRGFLLTGDISYLEPYESGVSEITTLLNELTVLTSDNSRQQKNTTQLARLAYEKLDELSETIKLYQGGDKDSSIKLILTHQGKRLMDDIRIIIGNMKFEERHLLSIRQNESNKAIQTANYFTSIGSVLTFLFIGTIAFLIKREVSLYISERKQRARTIKSSEKMLRNLMESAFDGIAMVDNNGKLKSVNERLIIMTGYTRAELIGNEVELLIPKRFRNHVKFRDEYLKKPYTRAMGTGVELCITCKNGVEFPVEISLNPITIDERIIVSVLIHDITKQKQMEEELKYLACHDPLTGLYSRNKMESKINDEIHRAARYQHTLSIFMLDIDHFKDVNDTYGHDVGDTVLKSVAKEIKNSIRTTDFASRYGGEEFIIILPETVTIKAEELAERLRCKIANSHFTTNNDKYIKLTVSIGIATFPSHAKTTHALLKAADTAMYEAKNAGRNQVLVV